MSEFFQKSETSSQPVVLFSFHSNLFSLLQSFLSQFSSSLFFLPRCHRPVEKGNREGFCPNLHERSSCERSVWKESKTASISSETSVIYTGCLSIHRPLILWPTSLPLTPTTPVLYIVLTWLLFVYSQCILYGPTGQKKLAINTNSTHCG